MIASASPTSAAASMAPAERLWSLAAAALAVMPFGMAVAHRSAPLFMSVSAVLALAALTVEREWTRTLHEARRALVTPLGLAALAFLAWSVLSIAWSEVPATSWRAFGEFWPIVAAAFVLSLTLPGRAPRWSLGVLAVAIALACISMLLELYLGLPVRKWLGVRSWQFIFNRPALTVMVTVVPVLVWLAAVPGWWARILSVGLGCLALVLTTVSWSGAATLGVVVMVLVFPLARYCPRAALGAMAFGLLAAILVSPVQGRLADALIPAKLSDRLAESHSRERIEVWLSFGAAIREQPLLGAGFGASPRLQDTSVADRVPRERRALLNIGHPHDAAMQVWTELGAVGALLASLILVLMLAGMRGWPARRLAPALCLLGGVAAVALVGHGAWQGWWAASVGAAIVWLRVAEHGWRGRI